MVIREKVKNYILEQNTREGTAGSGFGNIDALATTTTEVPVDNNSSAPANNAAQDRVDN